MHVSSGHCSSGLEPHGGEYLLEVTFLHQDCIFSFQIHVVHYNTKYASIQEAMKQPDGLAVLGAFLEVSPMAQP